MQAPSEVNRGLELLTDRIVQAADPERVILFGSRARRTSSPSSDFDIALIFDDRNRIREGIRKANQALWPRPFPLDLVGLATDTLENGRTALAREVAQSGRPLYLRNVS